MYLDTLPQSTAVLKNSSNWQVLQETIRVPRHNALESSSLLPGTGDAVCWGTAPHQISSQESSSIAVQGSLCCCSLFWLWGFSDSLFPGTAAHLAQIQAFSCSARERLSVPIAVPIS